MDNRSELDTARNHAQHDENGMLLNRKRIDDCEGVAMKALSTRILLGTIFCLFVTTALCWGQGPTAAITGQVTDASGAAVPSVAITAKDLDHGTNWPTVSNDGGYYSLPRLPIGNYEVRAEAKGFQTAIQRSVQLVIDQVAKIDFQLQVGQVTQTLEVTSAAPILQTENAQISTVMQAAAIQSLPLETRNYNQLALLMPGTVTTSPAAFNTGQATFNSGRPYINGNREQATYYLLDGMENIEFVDNNVAYSPNVDAIQEFNVVTNNPSAEYGQFLGGVISVSLKSGSNSYHGNAFEFARNDFFNANEWSRNFSSDPTVNSAPPNLQWNEYGGTLGGPIKKNKLFFFVDYQGSRFDTPATPGTINTFSNQERTGNLSDIPGISLHYPGTTVAMPANLNNAAICGPGQTFGSSPCIKGLSPTALKIMGALPQATLPGLLNNAPNIQQSYIHGQQGDAKVDYNLSDRDHLSVRYSQQSVLNPIVNSQPLLYNSTGNNVFPLWSGVIDYTRTISPNLVNEFRAGVNYFPAEANVQTAGSTSAAGLIPGQPTPFLPGLSFAGAPVGGALNGPFAFGTVDSPEIFHQTAIQFEDTLAYTHRSHNMKFGFQGIRYRNDYVPSVTSDGAAGQIGFNAQYTGNAEADFLLGLPSYMGYGQGFSGTVGQRNNAFGAFFQDDWKVNSHLTLNMGLRWQLFTPIYEVGNRMTNFGEINGQIELAGVNGNSRALYNQYNGIANFLPRMGLAWSPGGKWAQNTVIRAAFSRSSFQEGTGEYNRLATNAPWNVDLVSQPVAGPNGAIPANQITLDQGFGGLGSTGGVPCNVTTVTSAPASCFAGVRIHMQDSNYRPAVSNQWNFSIQRQFGNSTTFQAAYVGQHTDHLATIVNAGQEVLLANGSVTPGPYLSGNPTLKNIGTGQVRLNSTVGIQNYNALQLSFQRRLATGLAFQANYTWSKCLTDNQGYYARYGDATASQASADVSFQQYAYNIRQDYGFCDHDVTNVFNGYLTYELPFGKHRTFLQNTNKFVNAVVGDWQLNTVFTVHGGFPISMLDFGGDPGTGSFQPRPDCIAPSIQTPYKNFSGGGYIWFDPSTMAAPAPGHFGTCGVGTERGPGIKQVDMGLSKKFPITERQTIEVRFEAINAFNTPIFVVSGYVVDIFGGSNEGVVNTSQGARNLQFGLKYSF
ncbi:MAG TPA: carboxypeptidase regulatory-like domain-containing protein [Bryobacteraceae bacterium]|nr:carboxypeptidase regulatory-like domain-containing protein [Bryobacteraceae bacterium]